MFVTLRNRYGFFKQRIAELLLSTYKSNKPSFTIGIKYADDNAFNLELDNLNWLTRSAKEANIEVADSRYLRKRDSARSLFSSSVSLEQLVNLWDKKDVDYRVLSEFDGYVIFEDGTVYSQLNRKPIKAHIRNNKPVFYLTDINGKQTTVIGLKIITKAFMGKACGYSDVKLLDGNTANIQLINIERVSQ